MFKPRLRVVRVRFILLLILEYADRFIASPLYLVFKFLFISLMYHHILNDVICCKVFWAADSSFKE